jgi:hypothetical protein
MVSNTLVESLLVPVSLYENSLIFSLNGLSRDEYEHDRGRTTRRQCTLMGSISSGIACAFTVGLQKLPGAKL